MKIISSIPSFLSLLALAGTLVVTNSTRADLTYQVEITTTSLLGSAAGPFSLDFQSIYGSGLDQRVTLSNFVFTGGNPTGSPSLFGSGVAGSLASTLTFNDSAAHPFNEFYQAFSGGTTDIRFLLSLTTATAGVTPTSFSVAILDNALGNIPTSASNLSDALLIATLDGTRSSIATYHSVGDTLGVTATAVSAVPEASTGLWALGCVPLVLLQYIRRKRSTKA